MVLQAEDFTQMLELCSLRNGSRIVVNMAIMKRQQEPPTTFASHWTGGAGD
jgi:hypothetical protein